jgi:hypothetical protein
MVDETKAWPYFSQTKEEWIANSERNLKAFREQFNVPSDISSDDLARSLAEMFEELDRRRNIHL